MRSLNSVRNGLVLILIVSFSLFSLQASAEGKGKRESDPYGLVTCSTPTENRTLAIATKEEGGCDLHYEKYGKDKIISWSSSSVTPCMNSRDKVRKELEAAGWKCFQE